MAPLQALAGDYLFLILFEPEGSPGGTLPNKHSIIIGEDININMLVDSPTKREMEQLILFFGKPMFNKTTIIEKSKDKKIREIIESFTMMTMEEGEYVSSPFVKLTWKEYAYLIPKQP